MSLLSPQPPPNNSKGHFMGPLQTEDYSIPRTPSLTSSSGSASSSPKLAPSDYPSSATMKGKSPLSLVKPTVLHDSSSSPLSESPTELDFPSPLVPRPPRSRPPSFAPRTTKSKSQDRLSVISITHTQYRPRPKSRSSGILLDGHQSYLAAVCTFPKILQSLLLYLDLQEFRAVIATNKTMRGLFNDERTRDPILSRFVPGYRNGKTSNNRASSIRVDMSDLESLMISQTLALQQYPMHAIHAMTSAIPLKITKQLERLTQVHSRFVLLLRSRAPPVTSHWELDDPFWRYGGALELGNLRELTFPEPLTYFPPTPYSRPLATTSPLKKSRSSSVFSIFRSKPKEPALPRVITAVAAESLIRKRRHSRQAPLPPPQETPRAFTLYRARTHRRSASTWTAGQSKHISSLMALDESDLFTPPRPYHLRSASLPTSRTATASNSSHSLSRSQQAGGQSPASNHNPHDLAAALSRTRAPLCRVFVPTDVLSPSAILACEGQLLTAGLWQHLRIGDIVCNLGYVPRTNLDEVSAGGGGTGEAGGWLIFTGESLVPYFPPTPPPNINALSMPSPLYWAPLYPPFTNPRFFLQLPSSNDRRREPELSLVPLTASIRSPATRLGVARVKKYAWVGKLDGSEICQVVESRRMSTIPDNKRISRFSFLAEEEPSGDPGAEGGVGEGWNMEWVVETEGTPEGKRNLLEALNPPLHGDPPQTEWEVVRDKCFAGRIWLRLIIHPLPTASIDNIASRFV